MDLQFHPIVVVYFASCVIALFMAYSSRRIQAVSGSRIWGLTMLFCAIWSAGDGLETLAADLPAKLLIIRISYFGIIGTAVFWSFFIVTYSNNDRLLTPRVKKTLLILPIITYLSVLTFNLHPYFYKSIKIVDFNGFFGLSATYGPIFWAWAIFAYVAIFGSGILLIQSVLRFPHQFHGQIYLLIIAALFPLISNFLYITGNNFIEPFDPSAPAFVISGLLVEFNFRRYRFLDVVPVAHDLVFKHVNCGVVVIDNRGVILEVNPAAENMTEQLRKSSIGQPIQQTLFGNFISLDSTSEETRLTNVIKTGSNVYEIQQTPLIDRSGRKNGQILLFYDITALKKSEENLSEANELLKITAATDPLTQLANRRSFFEHAEKELSRAERRRTCFSLILIDLDNFKLVNDTKGHPFGDAVLQETARCLRLYSRNGDILGRYGGDEFIILAYNADYDDALALAERFQVKIPVHLAELDDMEIPVTLSIGVAAYEHDEGVTIDTLLDRADTALYKSKKSGRNMASVWRPGDSSNDTKIG